MALKIQRVKLTRSFRHRGDDCGVGSVLDLDMAMAQEMRNAKKVEFVGNDYKIAVLPLPPKKARAFRGVASNVDALTAQVAELKAVVEKLAPKAAPAKEKASA